MTPHPLAETLAGAQLWSIFQRSIVEKTFQVVGQVLGLLIALTRFRRQAFADDAFQAPGDIRASLPYRSSRGIFRVLVKLRVRSQPFFARKSFMRA